MISCAELRARCEIGAAFAGAVLLEHTIDAALGEIA
jgi:hypothetical protein